jgi:hypothetical protein
MAVKILDGKRDITGAKFHSCTVEFGMVDGFLEDPIIELFDGSGRLCCFAIRSFSGGVWRNGVYFVPSLFL